MDPNPISDTATQMILTAAAPYVKIVVVAAVTWAIGKAQQQGGPIMWLVNWVTQPPSKR